MYLDCFKNCGKPYLRIMQNFYNKIDGKVKITRKTIKNLGPLSKFDDGKPDLLLRLREKFKNGELVELEGIQLPSRNEDKKISLSEINFKLAPKNLGYIFLNQIYNELGIDILLNRIKSDSKIKYDLNGIVKLLVFGRILNPQSNVYDILKLTPKYNWKLTP